MYALPKTNFLRRSLLVNNESPARLQYIIAQSDRIRRQLKSLGASEYDLRTLESRYLPHIIHNDEFIQGVVYGWTHGDSVMLIATDKRLIYLDKKPLFVDEDEITYDVVSGVKYSYVGIRATVTLHTRIKDYVIHTFNKKCALGFVDIVERRCIEIKNGKSYYNDDLK